MGSKKERFHKNKGYRLTFGKHKGKTLGEVLEIDWEYILWLRQMKVLQIRTSLVTEANNKAHPTKT